MCLVNIRIRNKWISFFLSSDTWIYYYYYILRKRAILFITARSHTQKQFIPKQKPTVASAKLRIKIIWKWTKTKTGECLPRKQTHTHSSHTFKFSWTECFSLFGHWSITIQTGQTFRRIKNNIKIRPSLREPKGDGEKHIIEHHILFLHSIFPSFFGHLFLLFFFYSFSRICCAELVDGRVCYVLAGRRVQTRAFTGMILVGMYASAFAYAMGHAYKCVN